MSQALIHDHSTGTTAATGPGDALGTTGVPVQDRTPARPGARRTAPRRRALTALIASGALLVGLFGGFGLGRATAPDPFAGVVRMGAGAPADGAAPDSAAGTTGTTAPDPSTALDAGRTGPAVYLTAGLVSATTAPATRELLTA